MKRKFYNTQKRLREDDEFDLDDDVIEMIETSYEYINGLDEVGFSDIENTDKDLQELKAGSGDPLNESSSIIRDYNFTSPHSDNEIDQLEAKEDVEQYNDALKSIGEEPVDSTDKYVTEQNPYLTESSSSSSETSNNESSPSYSSFNNEPLYSSPSSSSSSSPVRSQNNWCPW